MKLKKYFPLCYIAKDVLLLYKYGSLYLLNIRTKEIMKQRKVIASKKELLLGRIDSLYRFFRMGARLGAYIGENNALMVVGSTIYEVNTQTLEMSCGFTNGKSRPLKFGISKGVKGFEDGVYWGDYMSNPDKHAVSIYKRMGVDRWKIVYTFVQGEINHVHSVVPDKFHNCIWVFTGDFGNGSAIWKATDNFSKMEPVFRGEQLYRSCVAFPTTDGVIYATDTPFTDDFIVRMYEEKGTWKIETIHPIDGSCIYGMQLNEQTYVFQTSVEPDGRNNGNKCVFFFGRTRGEGIKDDFVKLYVGNTTDGFKMKYKSKKDRLPYIAYQFGTFQFPESSILSDVKTEVGKELLLPFYSVATEEGDLVLHIASISS